MLPRSILNEEISRRGYHVTREYSADPLEVLMVKDVMRADIAAFPINMAMTDVRHFARERWSKPGQHLYPVVDPQSNELKGVIGLNDMVAPEEHTLNEERTRERW